MENMECDPVEHVYITQGTPEVTTDTDSDPEMGKSDDTKSNMARWASLERIREETRIVVLDYLGSLPADKLTARNFTRSESRAPCLTRAMSKLSKSSSDAGAYEHKRQKFLRMARLQRKLSLNLKRDIETFDQSKLRNRAEKRMDFYKRPNDLAISSCGPCFDHTPSPVLSPEGRVAARLDKISQEIMEMVPNLLDEPLMIIQAGSLSYEQFCIAARKLTFDLQIVGWSKVALLCHFAREVAIIGELDDLQLEQLAEHSLRFIQESTSEWIEKKGGWAAFDAEDENDILDTQSLLEKYREWEERDGKDAMQWRRASGSSSNRNSWDSWLKYGVAAAAVGIGVCYSLIKQ
ncbi:uncharacterized protein LOC110057049 [Orbicella faveolata]|uniref:uncharacterized protein LOC110057049 n=1 Tax=Orbicella faveolata TaxID=48498 RepID=UPI0009E5EDDF|nr:uncharacterized protein LOC110057049 [Orbicella faveolata]